MGEFESAGGDGGGGGGRNAMENSPCGEEVASALARLEASECSFVEGGGGGGGEGWLSSTPIGSGGDGGGGGGSASLAA